MLASQVSTGLKETSLGYPSSPNIPNLRITLGLQHSLKMNGYYIQGQITSKTILYFVAQTYLASGYVWE